MNQILGRDLRPGDILMKFNAGNITSQGISAGQRLVGAQFPDIVHAGIMFDNRYMIESQASGVAASDIYLQNSKFGYVAFRARQGNLAAGAATCAKLLFDVHQRSGALAYDLRGAIGSLLGLGQAKSAGEMDELMDRILKGRKEPFFCSRLVVFIYQYVAAQNGIPPSQVFSMNDAKASPSTLASHLLRNPVFSAVGRMHPHERN